MRVSAPEAWKSRRPVGFIYFSCSQGKTLFRQTGYQMLHGPGAEDPAGNFALNVHEIRAESLSLTAVTRRTVICSTAEAGPEPFSCT